MQAKNGRNRYHLLDSKLNNRIVNKDRNCVGIYKLIFSRCHLFYLRHDLQVNEMAQFSFCCSYCMISDDQKIIIADIHVIHIIFFLVKWQQRLIRVPSFNKHIFFSAISFNNNDLVLHSKLSVEFLERAVFLVLI